MKEAKACGIELRQSYTRKSKQSLVMQSRYAHARQMKPSRKEIRKLKTCMGRVVRDVERKVSGNVELKDRFAPLLEMGHRLLKQKRTDSGKLYSLHAPEVECISKGKAPQAVRVRMQGEHNDNFQR